MRILINHTSFEMPEGSLLNDAIALSNAKPPFAVAVNMQFIPKDQYLLVQLTQDDQVEIISPITGG